MIGSGWPNDPAFKWVNTCLGNIKSALTGTLRSCDSHHLARYLAAVEWRYNRRFDLAKNLTRLLRAATTIAPNPYSRIADVRIKAAEASG